MAADAGAARLLAGLCASGEPWPRDASKSRQLVCHVGDSGFCKKLLLTSHIHRGEEGKKDTVRFCSVDYIWCQRYRRVGEPRGGGTVMRGSPERRCFPSVRAGQAPLLPVTLGGAGQDSDVRLWPPSGESTARCVLGS